MEVVISVAGKDQVGVVHAVTGLLVDYHLDTTDIDQAFMDNCFTMVMLMDLSQCQMDSNEVLAGFDALGEEMGLKIRAQHKDIFTTMYQT